MRRRHNALIISTHKSRWYPHLKLAHEKDCQVAPPLRADAVPLSWSDRAEATAPGPAIGRVLVMPLVDASHDSTEREFGKLAAHVILSALTQTGLVDVVDAQTTASLARSTDRGA